MTSALRPPYAIPRPTLPRVLHVGSGKNFRADYLNLDVDPFWRPDVVYDLSRPLPPDGVLRQITSRFGEIQLGAESFDEIVAQEVLEHIRDLPTAMTTLLHLLRTGGVLKITVPHELSLGAWSDPTHLRAFNEHSFTYYSQWSWYLGWKTHNFALQKLEFVANDYGEQLSAQGRTLQELLRTPRTIDTIHVELKKQVLCAQEREFFDFYANRPLTTSP